MTARQHEQIANAYRRMALEAKYRPEAPSDGLGHVVVPIDELDLDAEATSYANRWLAEEREHTFHIGVPDYQTAVPMVYAVEAARLMCGGAGATPFAIRLLRMALDELGHE